MSYKSDSCAVKTDGVRVSVVFNGLSLGLFAGELEFTAYKGSNLLRQEAIASTQAAAFYGVIVGATVLGVGIAFTPIDPMKALYYSAVVNGVLAAPLMAAMMVIGSNPRIMGRLTLSRGLKIIGWAGTAVMGAAAVGLFLT